MPNVTVAGAGGATVTLSFDSATNALLAKSLAGAITAGVADGSIAPASSKSGPPPTVPAGQTGEWVQQKNGATFLPDNYTAIVATAKKSTIFGTGEDNVSVLATGGLTFHAGGGSGTVVAGGGDNRIFVPAGGTGAWSINTGSGDDSVQALGDGNDTVRAGAGRNVIQLGGGEDLVLSEGRDRIVLGSGSATIVAVPGDDSDDHGHHGWGHQGWGHHGWGHYGKGKHDEDDDDHGKKGKGKHGHDKDDDSTSQQVWGGSGTLVFVGGEGPATVFGGTGSATILGGSGNNEFHGGSAGNNLIFAGTGRATVIGGGDGDVLFAEGSRKQELHAGPGAATLFGALADGNNTFHAGPSDTMITGGWGNDTFVGGLGASTIAGGPGHDIYRFIDGLSGGADVVYGFDFNDRIDLDGYGKGAVKDALASQVKVSGGVMITLSDSTTVTFMGLSQLTKSSFE